MKTGTKSILYGAHCFLLHPFFVAAAWIKLYGFPWDPRVWVAFFVHDLGYWGKPNMDGTEGETHPELGAKIMHLFDGWDYLNITYPDLGIRLKRQEIHFKLNEGWKIADTIEMESSSNILFRRRSFKWHDFALYHSRYYAKRKGGKLSKLCYADKMAFCYTWRILYIPMTSVSGEINEYVREIDMFKEMPETWKPNLIEKLIWYEEAIEYTKEWVEEHKDGREDTWTNTDEHQKK